MPSLPPPKMIISSRMATARCPCRARGTGPVKEETRLQLRRLGAAIFPTPAPRPTMPRAPRAPRLVAGEAGHRLQRCAREARHVTRGPRPPHGPRPPQPAATWLALGAPPGWGAPPVHRPCLPLLCLDFPAGSPRRRDRPVLQVHSEHLPSGRVAPSRRLSRRSQVLGLGEGLGQNCHLTGCGGEWPGARSLVRLGAVRPR